MALTMQGKLECGCDRFRPPQAPGRRAPDLPADGILGQSPETVGEAHRQALVAPLAFPFILSALRDRSIPAPPEREGAAVDRNLFAYFVGG